MRQVQALNAEVIPDRAAATLKADAANADRGVAVGEVPDEVVAGAGGGVRGGHRTTPNRTVTPCPRDSFAHLVIVALCA